MTRDGLMRHEGGGAASSFTAITTDGAPTTTPTSQPQQQRVPFLQRRSWWCYAVGIVGSVVVTMWVSASIIMTRRDLGRPHGSGCDDYGSVITVDTSSYSSGMEDGDASSYPYYYHYELKKCWDHGVKGPTILFLDNAMEGAGRLAQESWSSETDIVNGYGEVSSTNYNSEDIILYHYTYTMGNDDKVPSVHITFDDGITYYDISEDTVLLIDATTQNDNVQVQQIQMDLSKAPGNIQSLSESNYYISSFIAQAISNYYAQQQQQGGDNGEGGRARN